MRLIFLFIFTSFLFACDTSNRTKAYQDYVTAKKNYIKAVLDNNTVNKINSLKNIVKCGRFLGFNVIKYENRLKQLTHKSPLSLGNKYIKLISTNPIKISLDNMKVHHFTLKKRGFFYHIFDIYNAKVKSLIVRKIGDKFLKIAQNNKNRVRVVVFAKYSFKISYSVNNRYLTIQLPHKIAKLNRNKIIVIDPGHGGKDPGGVGYHRILEKNIVLPIGKYLAYELSKRGYKVYLTRNKDKFITLRNRTKFANRKHADLFISLHCNIAPKHPEVYGIETYFLSPARSDRAKRVAKIENSAIGNLRSTTQNIILNFLNKNRIIDSTKLAIDIQKSLIYNLKKHYSKIKDGGVRPAPFWVLVGTQMPAILIETGFISNRLEAKRLISKTYQRKYAKYIADGIDNYLRKNH